MGAPTAIKTETISMMMPNNPLLLFRSEKRNPLSLFKLNASFAFRVAIYLSSVFDSGINYAIKQVRYEIRNYYGECCHVEDYVQDRKILQCKYGNHC